MMTQTTTAAPVMPFGKHRGVPISDVPSNYLDWVLRTCKIGSGLRADIRAELADRDALAPPRPGQRVYCGCPDDTANVIERREERGPGNRGTLWRMCCGCGLSLERLPQTAEHKAAAATNANPTDLLQTLILADEQDVRLQVERGLAKIAVDDWPYASGQLRRLVYQCRGRLGKMLRIESTARAGGENRPQ